MKMRKSESCDQPSVPANDVPVSVPASSPVNVIYPVSVTVPVLFRKINDWGQVIERPARFYN